MARDTRGPMPPATANLRRVSLNPPHWRQGRRLLAVEASATGLLGVVGLVGFYFRPRDDGWHVLGVPLTPGLSIVMLGIAVAATLAYARRRVAKMFTLVLTAVALAVMIICSVAAAHHEPGPLGFTASAMLLWALLFCYNLASAMWILPDQIQGPAWVPGRRSGRHLDAANSTDRGVVS